MNIWQDKIRKAVEKRGNKLEKITQAAQDRWKSKEIWERNSIGQIHSTRGMTHFALIIRLISRKIQAKHIQQCKTKA